jgi:predicted regulator of Ras-like GTPase activity (Roadblock/LC7/MglB family)
MVFQSVLSSLCQSLGSVQGALMLDAAGEVVVEAGSSDERLRLIGAYHGIALATARKAAERYETGEIEYLVSRHAWGTVVSRPLKDNYYFVLSLGPNAPVALAVHRSALAQQQLNAEI